MHEVGLAQSIIEIVQRSAGENAARRVSCVSLSIGELANVELSSLMQALTVGVRGTVLEGARFEVAREQGSGWCMACAKTVPVHRIGQACPLCGAHQVAVTGGTEMRVSEIEIED